MNQPELFDQTLPTPEEEASARHKFLILYAEPFRVLAESGGGHGAFAALSIGLFLCERYFRHKSDSLDAWREDKFIAEAARHFGTDAEFFLEFWRIYRHGILYQGAPLATESYGWAMNGEFSSVPTKVSVDGNAIICLSPWSFAEEMLVLCWNDPVALTRICSFSLSCAATVAPGWEFESGKMRS